MGGRKRLPRPGEVADRRLDADPRDDLFRLDFRKEIAVLNRYFIRPTTIDRIQASWIGEQIEGYVYGVALSSDGTRVATGDLVWDDPLNWIPCN